MTTSSIPGISRTSQASPKADAAPTRIAFVLVPEDPDAVDENPEDVEKVVRSACGRSRLSDVEIDVDADGRVTVEAVNPTNHTPSRVLHVTWGASEENYGTIPQPRDAPRLTWARGFLIEPDENEREGFEVTTRVKH